MICAQGGKKNALVSPRNRWKQNRRCGRLHLCSVELGHRVSLHLKTSFTHLPEPAKPRGGSPSGSESRDKQPVAAFLSRGQIP